MSRSPFQRFISELRRRHVPQTAAIYLVAAWAAIEFSDVVDGIVRKLLRRHPHVFPDGTLDSEVDPEHRPGDDEIRAGLLAHQADLGSFAFAREGGGV